LLVVPYLSIVGKFYADIDISDEFLRVPIEAAYRLKPSTKPVETGKSIFVNLTCFSG